MSMAITGSGAGDRIVGTSRGDVIRAGSGGAGTGTSTSVTVTRNANQAVTATFNLASYSLIVTKAGTGTRTEERRVGKERQGSCRPRWPT